MWRVYVGAIMIVGGIAAFIEAHSHHPVSGLRQVVLGRVRPIAGARSFAVPTEGLSPTAYDVLRIGAWALVTLGAATLLLGLIGYWRSVRQVA
jgi:uncharacterized membrane protein HdeD (DUF308 family)